MVEVTKMWTGSNNNRTDHNDIVTLVHSGVKRPPSLDENQYPLQHRLIGNFHDENSVLFE